MLRDVIESYVPFCEQEEVDRREILRLMDTGMDLMHRDFPAHFSASAWVVSPDREHILMAHHRIYHAWSWLGGHADGEEDLLSVAGPAGCGWFPRKSFPWKSSRCRGM